MISTSNSIRSAYEKISMREKLAYGSGDIATNLIGIFITASASYSDPRHWVCQQK